MTLDVQQVHDYSGRFPQNLQSKKWLETNDLPLIFDKLFLGSSHIQLKLT